MKPVLFVTNHVPPDRVGAFAALHERVPLRLALFGGRSHHATAGVADPGVPHLRVAARELPALARQSAAVVCGTAGRAALPSAWLAAVRARVPFVLWTALWQHPRTPAHVLAGAPLLELLYRRAAAVVTYGPHVSRFARAHGARRVFEAPQAVDNEFWSAAGVGDRSEGGFRALFVGRPARYKGLPELEAAWELSGLAARGGTLLAVGSELRRAPPGASAQPAVDPERLRNIYGACDVVVMPAVSTRATREPWGLVANEAMNQGKPVIATDAVGAAAGGLIRDRIDGLVVPERDPAALAAAMTRLADDGPLRSRLGASAREHVAAYTFEAWAEGFSAALRAAGATRERS